MHIITYTLIHNTAHFTPLIVSTYNFLNAYYRGILQILITYQILLTNAYSIAYFNAYFDAYFDAYFNAYFNAYFHAYFDANLNANLNANFDVYSNPLL